MSEPIDDKALDEYLERGSRISQRYRALVDDERASVPPELDRLVLAQARDALVQQDAAKADELARLRSKRRRLMQWGVPAALAASALLVISIVIRSGVQHEVRAVSERPVAAPAAAAPAAPVAAAKQQSTGTNAQDGVVLITPPPNAVTEFSPLAPPPAAPAERRASQSPAQSMAADTKSVRERIQSAPPPVPQVSNEVPQAPEPSAAVAASGAQQASASAIVPESQQARYESTAAKRLSSEAGRADLSEVAVTGARRATTNAGSGPRNTIPQSSFNKAASDETAREGKAEAASLQAEPQRWLEHIRQLRKDGKIVEADAEWKKFLERYPDYPVDASDAARGKPQ